MGNKKFKYWPYILIAGVVLIFSAFAPFLFSQLTWGVEFGEETGPIGDTIGGITAPFLSLVGSILVFAALRAQIQANDIVLSQLEKEDQEKIIDVKNKIEMLVLDIDAILDDMKSRGEKMKEYGDLELSQPFAFKVLRRTASNAYDRANQLDRGSLYKGFKIYFSDDNDWIKKYHKLYNHLDFLPAFFNDVYKKYEDNTKELVVLKSQTALDIDAAFTVAANTLKKIEDQIEEVEIPNHPYYVFVNDFIVKWYQFLESDERTVDVKLQEGKDNYFNPFVKTSITILKANGNDPDLMKLIELFRSVNMKIVLIEFKTKEFGNNVLSAHAQIMVDNEKGKCVYEELKVLRDWISEKTNLIQDA